MIAEDLENTASCNISFRKSSELLITFFFSFFISFYGVLTMFVLASHSLLKLPALNYRWLLTVTLVQSTMLFFTLSSEIISRQCRVINIYSCLLQRG